MIQDPQRKATDDAPDDSAATPAPHQASQQAPHSAASTETTPPTVDSADAIAQKFAEQLKEKENRYLYLYADFENYKKRAEKERFDAQKYGWQKIAAELLQVADNLERGIQQAPAGTDPGLIQGLQMVLKQLQTTFEKNGIAPIASLDQSFDPHFHEAVGQDLSDKPAGTIIREEQRGYTLHGRLLRAARVIVSMGPKQG